MLFLIVLPKTKKGHPHIVLHLGQGHNPLLYFQIYSLHKELILPLAKRKKKKGKKEDEKRTNFFEYSSHLLFICYL